MVTAILCPMKLRGVGGESELLEPLFLVSYPKSNAQYITTLLVMLFPYFVCEILTF